MANPPVSNKRASIQEAVAQLAAEESEAQANLPVPTPIVLPIIMPNSGLYKFSGPIIPLPIETPEHMQAPTTEPGQTSLLETQAAISPSVSPAGPITTRFFFEELRLDVDGNYPQMKASGQISGFKVTPAYWIANVAKTAPNTYEGSIWYKNGNVALIPSTKVKIEVTRTPFSPVNARVTFSGGGTPDHLRIFKYKSRYFHPVNFEFDAAQGVNPVLFYNTGSHPNRPASLPIENLSIATVYRRAGFDVSISRGGDTVPISEAHDAKWSDTEMHDAMQIHWSKFANAPQWALWTFFASLHEMGTSLGGIMFDDIGPNQRQGTSLFLDSFIKNAPPGDPAPAAFVNRMVFWTACHEMGHSFNLAHSWQKALGVQWIPLSNEPLARSFMNYPYNVPGGTSAFFSDFEFRFSDGELLFMRHAPFRFVEQGNADWFDHHAFRQANVSPEPRFSLSVECPGKDNSFEFLEPVVVHLALKNISGQPQLVDKNLLASVDRMTIIIKKRGRPARQLVPYSQRCWKTEPTVLTPNAEMKDSVFLVGRNGWDISEPGYYTVQASIDLLGEEVVSAPVKVRITPPEGYEEEYVAQDFFSDDVGRVLNFDGSRYLESANNTLREVVERLPKSKAAIHSRVALANPIAADYKQIEFDGEKHTLKVKKPDHREASQLVSVLVKDAQASTATLGQVDYNYYYDRFRSLLEEAKKVARHR